MQSENDEREHAASQQGEGAAASTSEHSTEPAPPAAIENPGVKGQGSPCPDCGSFTIKQSGCFVCISCGWSRCG